MLHWIEGGCLIKGGRLLSGGGVAYSREELVWYYSDFRRKDGGKKRTAKRMCVTIVSGLSLACFVVIFILH